MTNSIQKFFSSAKVLRFMQAINLLGTSSRAPHKTIPEIT